MVSITADDYDALKGFVVWMLDNEWSFPPGFPPEAHPLAVLEAFEAKSMAIARKSLGLAVGDMIEMTHGLTPQRVEEIDGSLTDLGLPTLSQVRARFSRTIGRILKRGSVRSEDDYYALRNVVEAMAEPERAAAWGMLADFEARAGGNELS